MRDGTATTPQRTDVRIMERHKPAGPRPAWSHLLGGGWAAGTAPYARADGRDMGCLFCGEQSCTVTDDDVAADTGRIRLRCTNSLCAVQVVEVLIYRDGTGLCGERPDVKGLDDIKPTRARDLRRADQRDGGTGLFALPVSDYYTYPDGVDPLQARVSGPAPWEE